MKDRSDVQRAKARSMMPGVATGVSNLGREMTNPAPKSPAMRLAPGPADKYVRPGTGSKERPIAAYAKGGKVESKAHEKAEMRADMRQDKKAVAAGVHKHERALHKGQPMTKLKHGGKAHMNRYADGGKVKVDEREVIEFSGPELDSMEQYAKYRKQVGRARGVEDDIAGEARANQMRKGKSMGAANDAAEVMGARRYAKGGAACAPRGKVGRYAMGGAAKVRQGWGQKVSKMPKGGNPVY